MTERSKIALACFIGAAIGTLTSILAAPSLWWLGLLTGFAGGYLAYEFRTVLREAPGAARAARKNAPLAAQAIADFFRMEVFVKAPFFHGGLVIGIACAVFVVNHSRPVNGSIVILGLALGTMVVVVGTPVLLMFAIIGSTIAERTTWNVDVFRDSPSHSFPRFVFEKTVDVTYWRVLRWTVEGVIAIPCVVVVAVAYGVWMFTAFLLKEIHSDKRLLCGFDSAIGCGVAWITLGSHGVSPMLAVLCGGILGAALGLMSWELVAKRLQPRSDRS